jgi:hypothetical protein
MKPCLFCGATGEPADDEHVIPKWARRAFDIQGPLTLHASDGPGTARQQVGRTHHLNIVLQDAICRPCNNYWLGSIEKNAARILKPMVVSAQPTVLDPAAQALVAFWAVKTCLLLELAIRQQCPGQRTIEGYQATPQELAWLREKEEPPPRSMAWLGCWDCQNATPVNYEPSGANLPTADGSPVAGHLTTFTLGYAAFQVFSVDFLAAEQHAAPVWNPRPPAPLREGLPRIWPPLLGTCDLRWPPSAFARDDWRRIVTWDGVLRPGEQPRPS